jgi:hypothetical protein
MRLLGGVPADNGTRKDGYANIEKHDLDLLDRQRSLTGNQRRIVSAWLRDIISAVGVSLAPYANANDNPTAPKIGTVCSLAFFRN